MKNLFQKCLDAEYNAYVERCKAEVKAEFAD